MWNIRRTWGYGLWSNNLFQNFFQSFICSASQITGFYSYDFSLQGFWVILVRKAQKHFLDGFGIFCKKETFFFQFFTQKFNIKLFFLLEFRNIV